MEEDEEENIVLEVPRLMDQYPTFKEFLKTTDDYTTIRERINRKLKGNKLYRDIEAEFTANINIRNKVHYTVPEFPKKWEKFLEEQRGIIENELETVNEFVDMGRKVYPKNKNIFRFLTLLGPKDCKVIIIGMDPYYNGTATGVAFGTNGRPSESLQNVYKELKRTHGGCPKDGNIDFWGEQGVLLMNACLTVNEGDPGSHGTTWTKFNIRLLNYVFTKNSKVVVCLWGGQARKFFNNTKINYRPDQVKVIECGHPSPKNTLVPFYESKCFKKIDKALKKFELDKIDWIS